jgi:hypothetical protein
VQAVSALQLEVNHKWWPEVDFAKANPDYSQLDVHGPGRGVHQISVIIANYQKSDKGTTLTCLPVARRSLMSGSEYVY